MSLNTTALVTLNQARNYIQSNPASTQIVSAEYVGMGDGGTKVFTLDHTPISGSLQLYVNGTLKVEDTDFTLSTATVTFGTAPTLNHPITASYTSSASDNTFEDLEDELIENLINAATQKCEDYTGRAFIQRSITEYQYGDGTEWLRLRKTPVSSITSVTLDETALTVSDDYTDFSKIGRLKRSAWDYEELITIVYTAGYGETRAATQTLVPDAVTAVLIAVANWYENRLGVKTESVTGIGSASYGETDELPEAAKNCLSSLRMNLI
jgi:uncharacterized phiE125 gp8 family phage protein